MADLQCFPQLDSMRATQEWATMRRDPLEALEARMGTIQCSDAVYYPTAMRRADTQTLAGIRTGVIEHARQYGYPVASRGRKNIDFDREVACLIYEEMEILPADAASNDVWNFLNLRVLADILVWRWGTWHEDGWNVSPDRLFQFQRTAFGRLWWRSHLLGPEAVKHLGEDQVVQLVERPRISGYPPLARSVSRRLLADVSGNSRDDLLRVVMKRLGRRLAVTHVHGMAQDQLDSFVDQVFDESSAALSRRE
ncbi:DUF6339 family protein [Sinomonas sp. P47F7]|uniref:DUF6339 family protein n=1 Tax=Sinomonas sp. P47F7 TaxID=3410987 RepID=UPI003BF4DDBD